MPVLPTDEPSELARRIIDEHRRARALPSEAKGALLKRIEGSIAAGGGASLERAIEGAGATASGSGSIVAAVVASGIGAVIAGVIALSPAPPESHPTMAPEPAEAGHALPEAAPAKREGPVNTKHLEPEPEPKPRGSTRSPAPTPVPPAQQDAAPTAKETPRDVARPSGQSDLQAEMQLLARARSALVAGDHERARRLVAQHRSRFPKGQLVEDREVLDLKALCVSDRDDARRRALAFLQSHPGSLAADSVDDVCP